MQDRQVMHYPEARKKAQQAVGDRLKAKVKTLPSKIERHRLWACIEELIRIAPNPRVSRMLGEFLIDMANESDKQDKIYGTDTNDENQMVAVIRKVK